MIELLVVIAVIGILTALLLPAVQAAREAGRRMKCANNLRQLGIGLHNYHDVFNCFPAGNLMREDPGWPGYPADFFAWGVLAQTAPYLEQTSVANTMNLSYPIYVFGGPLFYEISPPNQFAAGLTIPLFLCPSDVSQSVEGNWGVASLGPTNYAACNGTGLNGGSPNNTDGIFYTLSWNGFRDITDGSSNTAAMSESLLGAGGQDISGPMPLAGLQRVYAYLAGSPMSNAACSAASNWNFDDLRGFLWMSGEIRCSTYNHYYLPNQPIPDCISYGPSPDYEDIGWRAARSAHPGGVNLLLADGSGRFVTDSVNAVVWLRLATRGDGQPVPEY